MLALSDHGAPLVCEAALHAAEAMAVEERFCVALCEQGAPSRWRGRLEEGQPPGTTAAALRVLTALAAADEAKHLLVRAGVLVRVLSALRNATDTRVVDGSLALLTALGFDANVTIDP